jgi:O-antigen/teichoic acid export membrane protein
MFQEIRRLTKHTLIYGVGHIFSGLVGFLLLPLHTHLLPAESLGALAMLRMSLAFGHLCVLHGLEVGFVQYFGGRAPADERRRLLSTVFWAAGLVGMVVGLALWFGAGAIAARIPAVVDWEPLFRISAVILLLDALATPLFLALRAEERSRRYVGIRMTELGVDLVGNCVLIGFLGFGLIGVFWSQLAGRLVAGSLLLPGVRQYLGWTFSRVDWKHAMQFGLPAATAGVALLVVDVGDRWFITRLLNVAATGVYFAGYRIAMAMALIVAAFRFAWHPFFLSIKEQADAPMIFSRILTYYVLIAGWVCLTLSLLAEDIVQVNIAGFTLFGEEYLGGLPIVPVIALSYLLYGVYSNLDVGVYVKEKTRIVPLIIGLGALVNIGLNWLLIPRMGLMGAAAATAAAYLTMCVCMYAASRRLLYIQYEWGRIGIVMLIACALYAVGAFARHWVADLLLAAMYPGMLYLFGFFRPSALSRLTGAIRKRLTDQ